MLKDTRKTQHTIISTYIKVNAKVDVKIQKIMIKNAYESKQKM